MKQSYFILLALFIVLSASSPFREKEFRAKGWEKLHDILKKRDSHGFYAREYDNNGILNYKQPLYYEDETFMSYLKYHDELNDFLDSTRPLYYVNESCGLISQFGNLLIFPSGSKGIYDFIKEGHIRYSVVDNFYYL